MLARRLLNTQTAPVLYLVNAVAKGARNGHVNGSEGLAVDLTMPKPLGENGENGENGKTNPEEFFAACYAACFQGAINLTAMHMGITLPKDKDDSILETTAHMVGELKKKAGDCGSSSASK